MVKTNLHIFNSFFLALNYVAPIVAWIVLAVFTIRHTDTINTILFSATPIRPLLHISIIQITINFILMLYLGIYLLGNSVRCIL